LLVVAALGTVRDLASAACVREALGARRALFDGVATFARFPLRVARGVAPPAAAALGLVLLAAWLTGVLDVARPGAWRVAAVLLVHQLAVLGLVLCRAWWLGHALGLVGAQPGAASVARR
jgi:hypothetical protein